MPEYITAPVRFIDGAGAHVRRFTPSKRIKSAHRKYGAGSTLTEFARQCTKPALPGFPTAPDGVASAAAIAWLKNKGR